MTIPMIAMEIFLIKPISKLFPQVQGALLEKGSIFPQSESLENIAFWAGSQLLQHLINVCPNSGPVTRPSVTQLTT